MRLSTGSQNSTLLHHCRWKPTVLERERKSALARCFVGSLSPRCHHCRAPYPKSSGPAFILFWKDRGRRAQGSTSLRRRQTCECGKARQAVRPGMAKTYQAMRGSFPPFFFFHHFLHGVTVWDRERYRVRSEVLVSTRLKRMS